ncbi:MAG: hypothetical protein ABIN48_11045 [Ginsengibacter sp.]
MNACSKQTNNADFIKSFQWLVQHELVYIYGYVIMDNPRLTDGQDVHVLWEQLKMNRKETPKESFKKYTGHIFLKQLNQAGDMLSDYKAEQNARNFIFWQRDPLSILITSRILAGEKLDYMHYNPLQAHWQLSKNPTEYRFSSARFYETEEDEFKILTHYMDKL